MYPDRRFEVKWKGVCLPYSVFAKDQQRVTHAAITENKHLNAVLANAREIQDKEGPPKSRPTGRWRTRYKPTGRKSPEPKSFVDSHIEARRAREKMQSQAAPGLTRTAAWSPKSVTSTITICDTQVFDISCKNRHCEIRIAKRMVL
ncbi:MAG: hypothetical protein GY761_19815 [Hyphomicrobiales bacterium]|nr:hypothetical protein [Hyphomicrobiales bacterium]